MKDQRAILLRGVKWLRILKMAERGRPPGTTHEKLFGAALRLEIKAAGDQKDLRVIARNLLQMAKQPDAVGLAAIRELGDRLDGKARQESEVTVRAAAARELTDDDLAAIAVGAEQARRSLDETPAEVEAPRNPNSSKMN
jgi:hypothetical protein